MESNLYRLPRVVKANKPIVAIVNGANHDCGVTPRAVRMERKIERKIVT
jgi:hypothetical protein